jgi:3-oxo-5alpha-steroid 4-dehydrogenase
LWFQRLQAAYLLTAARVSAPTVAGVGAKAGVDPEGLAGLAPVLTLGGLAVAEDSGLVLRPDGSPVDCLYAAGRNAAGLCSNSYVIGLSLADCAFSGRRAGWHAATTRSASARKPKTFESPATQKSSGS